MSAGYQEIPDRISSRQSPPCPFTITTNERVKGNSLMPNEADLSVDNFRAAFQAIRPSGPSAPKVIVSRSWVEKQTAELQLEIKRSKHIIISDYIEKEIQ